MLKAHMHNIIPSFTQLIVYLTNYSFKYLCFKLKTPIVGFAINTKHASLGTLNESVRYQSKQILNAHDQAVVLAAIRLHMQGSA